MDAISQYQCRSFEVIRLFWDHDATFNALQQPIMFNARILVQQATPGRHTPVAERMIRTIKERARAIYSSLD